MLNLTGTSVALLRVFASATIDVKSNRHLYCPLCLFARVTTAVVSWPSAFTRWILCWWRSLTISCTEPASTVVCWTCRLWTGSWDLGQYRHYPEPDVCTVTTLNLMCVPALPWTWCVYRHYPEPDVCSSTTLNLMCVAALPWTWCVYQHYPEPDLVQNIPFLLWTWWWWWVDHLYPEPDGGDGWTTSILNLLVVYACIDICIDTANLSF